MTDTKIQASARVQITLDIDSGSTWGEGTDIAQVHRQAVEGALSRLRAALDPNPPTHRRPPASAFKLVGEPKVIMVTAQGVGATTHG